MPELSAIPANRKPTVQAISQISNSQPMQCLLLSEPSGAYNDRIERKAAAIQAVRMSAPSFFGVERSFYYNEKR